MALPFVRTALEHPWKELMLANLWKRIFFQFYTFFHLILRILLIIALALVCVIVCTETNKFLKISYSCVAHTESNISKQSKSNRIISVSIPNQFTWLHLNTQLNHVDFESVGCLYEGVFTFGSRVFLSVFRIINWITRSKMSNQWIQIGKLN